MKRSLKSIRIVIIALLVGFMFPSQANDFPKSIQKKIDKEVQKIFPIDGLIMNSIDDLNLDFFAYKGTRGIRVSTLKWEDELMGLVCFASSKGKNDYFDYMVLFNENLEIQKVVVLIYRSSYGGEIMAKSWLKQFIGKVKGEEMEFGKDIDGISGATLSAPSITKGVKSLSLLLNKLKANGKI